MPVTNFGGIIINTDHIVRISVDENAKQRNYTVTFIDGSWMYIYSDMKPDAYSAFDQYVKNVPRYPE